MKLHNKHFQSRLWPPIKNLCFIPPYLAGQTVFKNLIPSKHDERLLHFLFLIPLVDIDLDAIPEHAL